MMAKRLFVLLFTAIMCIGIVGCSVRDGKLVYLDYGTGIDPYGRYNTELYGMNGPQDPDGADPGVFYVSEDEDPQWGGWFYRYTTGNSTAIPETEYYIENEVDNLFAYCDRSKDLYHWEPVGVLAGGYCAQVSKLDWCGSDFWAPEAIRNPGDGKYYLYFSASARSNWGVEYISNSTNNFDRLYLGVAVSDTPAGPFEVICDYDVNTGIRIPTINFQTGLGLEYNNAAIDASPFFDGNGELYLYFADHPDDHSSGETICGMKMKSMAYPDYTTVTVLTAPGAATVNSSAGSMSFTKGEDYFVSESGINEAPFMVYHNGTYHLTYASNGYAHISYSVHQAIGNSPLGPFTKVDQENGNPVHDGSLFGDVHGTAHHSFVKNGDELWLVYHRHGSVYDGVGWSRPTAVDRVNFVTNSQDQDVLTSNGPSRTLTWLPAHISGYENLAKTAQITVNNGSGGQYLVDDVLPLYQVAENRKLSIKDSDLVITLKWQKPVSVSALMVYNAVTPEKGFSKLSDVRFKLADSEYDWAVIKNLSLQAGGWDPESEDYLECAPAVAEFDEIWITELQITIEEGHRLLKYNKQGEINTALDVTEIVVLGGAADE